MTVVAAALACLGLGQVKTTFLLDEEVRQRLKTVAVARGTTVTTLLTEGAELALARYEGVMDVERLRTRATAARKRMRDGLYSGPTVSNVADALVYGVADGKGRKRRG